MAWREHQWWPKSRIWVVYMLTHRASGRCYIGQTEDLVSRLKGHHSSRLRPKTRISAAIASDGMGAFEVAAIAYFPNRRTARQRERSEMVLRQTFWPNGFNVAV